MDSEQKKLLQQLAQIGDVVLISDGNKIQLDKNAKIPLLTQADAILYFLQRLDIDMDSSILEDNRTYQNFAKPLFIKKLEDAFDKFIEKGNSYLNKYEGFCNAESCNFKCKGFSFVGNKSSHYFNLIIEIKDGVVLDIYECTIFENYNQNIESRYRIAIDEYDVPF